MPDPETIELLDALSVGAPDVLFHYTTATGLTGIITSKALWATSIHHLNDESELQLALQLADLYLQETQQKAVGPRRELLDAIADHLKRVSQINICVFSLSAARDLLSQWRAYCAEGGYAIGFNSARLAEIAAKQGFRLACCLYDERRQQQFVRDLVNSYLAGFDDALAGRVPSPNQVDRIAERFATHFVQLAPLLKHKSFEEEREWRLVSEPLDVAHSQMKYRPSRGVVLPYFEISLSEMNPLELPEVMVGPMPDRRLAIHSLSNFLSKCGVVDWTVTESTTPYRNW